MPSKPYPDPLTSAATAAATWMSAWTASGP
uniref:Uncharacterized protein n=1 Tax=Arundo donax TaxID=35708 RepID=A0A0A9HC44_ARUDO